MIKPIVFTLSGNGQIKRRIKRNKNTVSPSIVLSRRIVANVRLVLIFSLLEITYALTSSPILAGSKLFTISPIRKLEVRLVNFGGLKKKNRHLTTLTARPRIPEKNDIAIQYHLISENALII